MKTVLVVEDNPINWRVFEKILTKKGGFAAKHTEDVEEVMECARTKEADVILMDIALANSYYEGKAVDGIKITKLLKAHPKTSEVPVILVTANGTEGDRQNFLEQSGADGYIPKPIVDYQDFLAQINNQLN